MLFSELIDSQKLFDVIDNFTTFKKNHFLHTCEIQN